MTDVMFIAKWSVRDATKFTFMNNREHLATREKIKTADALV